MKKMRAGLVETCELLEIILSFLFPSEVHMNGHMTVSKLWSACRPVWSHVTLTTIEQMRCFERLRHRTRKMNLSFHKPPLNFLNYQFPQELTDLEINSKESIVDGIIQHIPGVKIFIRASNVILPGNEIPPTMSVFSNALTVHEFGKLLNQKVRSLECLYLAGREDIMLGTLERHSCNFLEKLVVHSSLPFHLFTGLRCLHIANNNRLTIQNQCVEELVLFNCRYVQFNAPALKIFRSSGCSFLGGIGTSLSGHHGLTEFELTKLQTEEDTYEEALYQAKHELTVLTDILSINS